MAKPSPSKDQPWGALIALALAVPLACAPQPVKANTAITAFETLHAATEDGVLGALLARLFQSNGADHDGQRSKVATPKPRSTAADPEDSRASTHWTRDGGPMTDAIATAVQDTLVETGAQTSAAQTPAGGADPSGTQAIDDALDVDGSATADDTNQVNGSFDFVGHNGWFGSISWAGSGQWVPLDGGVMKIDDSHVTAGPVASSPGPLPVAAALAGWDGARRLRRRCRQASNKSGRRR